MLCPRCQIREAKIVGYDPVSQLEEYVECDDCSLSTNKKYKSQLYQKNISFIPERFRDINLKKTLDLEKNYFLFGSVGTMKTTIACGIMKQAIEQGINSLFISHSELLLESYDNKDLLNKCKNIGFLVLDDLFASKCTEWYIGITDNLIDYRYCHKKRTVITSNFSIENISSKFDDRIASRIAGSYVIIERKGSDKRLNNDYNNTTI